MAASWFVQTWVDGADVVKSVLRGGFRDFVPLFCTVAELRTITTSGLRCAIIGGSIFKYDSADTTTADDGATVIVSADGARFKIQGGGYTPPVTTKGDIFGFSTVATRVAVGTNGRILSADSTQAAGLAWVDRFDNLMTTKGDITVFGTTPVRMAVGADGTVLMADSASTNGVKWGTISGGYSPPVSTKGDLFGYSTAPGRIPIGTNGQVLIADSTQAFGLKWGAALASPLTTKGDLWGFGSADARLGVGSDGQFLVADSTAGMGVAWKTLAATFAQIATAAIGTASEYLSNTASKLLSVASVWSAAAPVSVSYAATVTLDLSTGINFNIGTLTGNVTFANPSNIKPGQSGWYRVTQDATGSRIASFGSQWKPAGGSAQALTTTASKVDIVYYSCLSSTEIVYNIAKAVI